jgi:hypothetical protein
MVIVSTDCSGADLENIEKHAAPDSKPSDHRRDAGPPGKNVPRHDRSTDRVGDQRARGHAAHAELRHRSEPEAEDAAENDLTDR